MKKILISVLLCFALLLQLFCVGISADVIGSDMNGHWAKEYGMRLLNLGIMNGYEDGTFKLGGTITRAEFTKLLVTLRYGNYRTYTEEVFTDVPESAWYFNYVCTAFEEGILEEKEGDKFVAKIGGKNFTIQDDLPYLEFFAAKICVCEFMADEKVWGEDLTKYEGFLDAVKANMQAINEGKVLL